VNGRPGSEAHSKGSARQTAEADSVVFSFFKKDPKDASVSPGKGAVRSSRPSARPLQGPVNRNAAPTQPKTANTENTVPDKDLHRTLAIETAAKIDAIESEMARDFMRPSGGGSMFSNSAANSTLGRLSQQPVEQPLPPNTAARRERPESIDLSIEEWQGNANAIEIHGEGSGSAIDEAAILFANGLIEPAESGLRAAIHSDSLGDAAQQAWLMLFELFQQRGDKAAFDNLTIEYVLRFESSPPAWIDYKEDGRSAVAGKTAEGAPIVRLPETVDANVVRVLEQLKNHSVQHQSLTLDTSGVREIDMVGAELLLRVISAFKRASHELMVLGADQLITPLRAAVEPGRRDQSDAAWMLLLEVFRLLLRQHDFEETGIQYCITYEVSPPSWEPPPPSLKTRAATPADRAVAAVDEANQWRGTVRGNGEPQFGRLLEAARTEKRLSIDCTYLKRIEFATATSLLTLLTKLRQSGVSVEFRNVNHLISALFTLLGVDMVADVQLRRL
jgi:ABC-type transporter Mla MlaB component